MDPFKKKRNFKKLFLTIFVSVASLYTTLGLYFLHTSHAEEQKTRKAFFKKSPNLIAVFTGDTGRIPFALKTAKSFDFPPLFITGVSSKLATKKILHSLEKKNLKNFSKVKFDYQAKNTLENVIYTLSFASKNKNYEKILIISHDYHILRIKHIIEKMTSKQEVPKFYYYGISKNYFNFRNLKILFKEVYKVVRTYAFLSLWEKELTQPIPLN